MYMYSNLLCMYIIHMYMFKENAFRLHHDNDVLMYVEEIYVLLRYDSCLFSIVHIYGKHHLYYFFVKLWTTMAGEAVHWIMKCNQASLV